MKLNKTPLYNGLTSYFSHLCARAVFFTARQRSEVSLRTSAPTRSNVLPDDLKCCPFAASLMMLLILIVNPAVYAQENDKDSIRHAYEQHYSRQVSSSDGRAPEKGVIDWHQYLILPGFDFGISDKITLRANSLPVYTLAGAEINYHFLQWLQVFDAEIGYWAAYDFFLPKENIISHGPLVRAAYRKDGMVLTGTVLFPVNFVDYDKRPAFSLTFRGHVGRRTALLCEYSNVKRYNNYFRQDTGDRRALTHSYIYALRFFKPAKAWTMGLNLIFSEKYNNVGRIHFIVPFVQYSRRIRGKK